jgi:hypothetical protein
MSDINDLTMNVNICSDNDTKKVTVTTDGAKERLDVAATVEGSFQLEAFTPVVNFSSASTALATSPTWTSILSVTDTGKLDFIAIAGSTSTYRVRLTLDSVIIFNVTMSDLSTVGLSNATNVPMWAETADKNFRYRPSEGVDFVTSFLVEAQLVSGSPTVSWMIHHRIS